MRRGVAGGEVLEDDAVGEEGPASVAGPSPALRT